MVVGKDMMRSRSKCICICAALAATGMLVSYLETFIVLPVNIPGIRLGLANIATLMALYMMGPVYALYVLITRVLLSAILFGSATSFVYSFLGAVISYVAMLTIRHYDFSIYSVSATGAVFHNVAQIFAAYIIVSNGYVFMYLPALIIAGVAAGLLTGFGSITVIKRLNMSNIINESEGIT